MAEIRPSRLAAEVLAAALCSPRSDADATRGQLRVFASDPATVEALLPLLEDARLEHWADYEPPFVEHHAYIGRLQSGLTLVIVADGELVPSFGLPEVWR